jgi:hypothetical protein
MLEVRTGGAVQMAVVAATVAVEGRVARRALGTKAVVRVAARVEVTVAAPLAAATVEV